LLLGSEEDKEIFHTQGLQSLKGNQLVMPSGRRLQTDVQIDVLVVYTTEAIETTAQQLETEIVSSFLDTNLAIQNSGIDLTFNLVHVAQTTYEQVSLSAPTALSELRNG
ncbi:unnamed protein product, partial [Choristocarpus tenellus]